jgi:hypothetical protein
MKTFGVAASIVLVSILFCPMVMAAPSMPDDVQIVQPDPLLSKELSAFLGKWDRGIDLFIIIEKIDEEKDIGTFKPKSAISNTTLSSLFVSVSVKLNFGSAGF